MSQQPVPHNGMWWSRDPSGFIHFYVSKNQIDRSEGRESGRSTAIAGIVLGWIGVGTLLLIIVLASTAGSQTIL